MAVQQKLGLLPERRSRAGCDNPDHIAAARTYLIGDEGDSRDCEHKSDGVGSWFQSFAARTSCAVGSKWAFFGAISLIVIWALAGPYFKYSDTWQLVVNTATTIVTFLMVFLIQNTQNRDARDPLKAG